jgi:hypothetical protein
MNGVKYIIVKILIVFISFFFIDGGKTVLLIGNNLQIFFNHNQNNDLEIPHQHNFNKYDDEGKWMKLNSFEFVFSFTKLSNIPYYLIQRTKDFTEPIWQPPKTL